MKPDFIIKMKNDITKRIKFREEFIKRNKEYQELKKELKNDYPKLDVSGRWNKLVDLSNKLFPEISHALALGAGIESAVENDDEESFAYILASHSIASVEIVLHAKGIDSFPLQLGEVIKVLRLNEEARRNNRTFVEWKKYKEETDNWPLDGLGESDLALDAIDEENATITIKIHLDRKKEEIIRDVTFLLDLLDWEAKALKKQLKRPKPHWEEYKKYLQVWDLREEKKSWREIASQVFPDDEDMDSAIRKVRHLWGQANKMINKGGWKKI